MRLLLLEDGSALGSSLDDEDSVPSVGVSSSGRHALVVDVQGRVLQHAVRFVPHAQREQVRAVCRFQQWARQHAHLRSDDDSMWEEEEEQEKQEEDVDKVMQEPQQRSAKSMLDAEDRDPFFAREFRAMRERLCACDKQLPADRLVLVARTLEASFLVSPREKGLAACEDVRQAFRVEATPHSGSLDTHRRSDGQVRFVLAADVLHIIETTVSSADGAREIKERRVHASVLGMGSSVVIAAAASSSADQSTLANTEEVSDHIAQLTACNWTELLDHTTFRRIVDFMMTLQAHTVDVGLATRLAQAPVPCGAQLAQRLTPANCDAFYEERRHNSPSKSLLHVALEPPSPSVFAAAPWAHSGEVSPPASAVYATPCSSKRMCQPVSTCGTTAHAECGRDWTPRLLDEDAFIPLDATVVEDQTVEENGARFVAFADGRIRARFPSRIIVESSHDLQHFRCFSPNLDQVTIVHRSQPGQFRGEVVTLLEFGEWARAGPDERIVLAERAQFQRMFVEHQLAQSRNLRMRSWSKRKQQHRSRAKSQKQPEEEGCSQAPSFTTTRTHDASAASAATQLLHATTPASIELFPSRTVNAVSAALAPPPAPIPVPVPVPVPVPTPAIVT